MWRGIYFLTLPLLCLCSDVLDEYSQKAVIVSDYCPSIPGCQDGTHVMCLHYNPNREMGPSCVHTVKVSVTTELAQLFLDVCNRIRSKVANGMGKGVDGSELPKGYGMYKLSWDPELATLAQVWANQCILKTDFCRSTKRFPNAGQVIGMIRFTVPDWMPPSMLHHHQFNTTTLTPDKIRFVIISILRAWYEMKSEVTSDMITYLDVIGFLKHNQFLQLVSGRSTHMGCGLSAYREYTYSDNNAALNFNSVEIICNFSYRPRVGEPVYTIKPPTETGYTLKCGCPLGYDEDEDCLCYESDRGIPFTCKESGRCKPSVVVLPIFTVEDAPLNILGQKKLSPIIETTTLLHHKALKHEPFIDYTRSSRNNAQIIKQDSVYKTRRISTDVKNRYFGTNTKQTNNSKTKLSHGTNNRRNNHRQSIFAKAAVFELPSSKLKQVVHNKNYQKDVKPRKDFTKVQKLVSQYLEGRKIGHPFQKSKENHNLTYILSVNTDPQSSPNKVTNKVNNINRFTKHKFTYKDLNSTKIPVPKYEIKPFYEENDEVFMNLLNELEKEVKNIDFNKKEKDMFDEKIRKIYGTLVKKPVVDKHSLLNGNISINKDIFDYSEMQNNVNLRNYWVDPNRLNEYTYSNLEDNIIKKYNDKSVRGPEEKNYGKHNENIYFRSESRYIQNTGDELRNMHPRKKSYLKYLSKGNVRNENYYKHPKSHMDDYNALDSARRRHHYKNLNNKANRISMMKKHGRDNILPENFHLRPVRPSKHENMRRSRPKEMDLYMPNRARFIHGF